MPFKLRVNVDPALAIAEGNAEFGGMDVEITSQQLCAESAEIRKVISDAHVSGVAFGPLRAGSWNAIKERAQLIVDEKLTADAHKKLEESEAKKKASEDESRAAKLKLGLHKWITANGDDSQKERYKQGLMSDKSILTLVMDDLFDDISQPRYVPIRAEEFCECGAGDLIVAPHRDLSDDAFYMLEQIREDAPKGAETSTLLHRGVCTTCKGDVTRYSVRVSVPWNGVTLKREYALPR